MAESDGEDRTEDPTEKRKRDSREEGQLPRSRELGTVAVMLSGVGGLLMYGAFLGGKLLEVMRSNFSLRRGGAPAGRAGRPARSRRRRGRTRGTRR